MYAEIESRILDEVRTVLDAVDECELQDFLTALEQAQKVFLCGVGRVSLMAATCAKRLNHLRIPSFLVGETTNPPIRAGDLLVACSGSGETLTVLLFVDLAKKNGVRIVGVGANKESSLRERSDLYVQIPAKTKTEFEGVVKSEQPMTNLFEQSLLIFFDIVTILLQQKKGITEEEMWSLHANLE